MPRPRKGEQREKRVVRLELTGKQKRMFEELMQETGFTDGKAFVWHLIVSEYEKMIERKRSRRVLGSSER